jgi:prepilin-type N-terminal cleavage/methylation domain-containing protein
VDATGRRALEPTAVSANVTLGVPSSGERGFSLIETMVGLGILLVVAAGAMPLAILTLTMTENQGHLVARSSEYAQDKLEQLMALSFGDSVTDTRVFPAAATGGTGLRVGGSSNPAAPVFLYVDYLNEAGTLINSPDGAPPAGWFYQRAWQIEEVGAADANCPIAVSAAQICLKRITITATVRRAASGGPVIPRVTVVALKTYPF